MSGSGSSVLYADLLDGPVQRWQPPDVGAPPPPEPAPAPEPEVEPEPERYLPTAAEIEAIEQAARDAGYEAGFESGYKEGRELGQGEAEKEGRARYDKKVRETVEALEGVARDLADPLAAAADALEPELLALVVAMARRVVMAELEQHPEHVARVLGSALGQLPSRNREIRVRINPEDAEILEAYARDRDERISWRPDPEVARGGCIVESGPSRIDATLEERLRQGVEALWGEVEPAADEPVAGGAEPSSRAAAVDAPVADADAAPGPASVALADEEVEQR
ncbi:FliH/SctL family protein [Marichromatium gracile]|uniref:FliH/SctL family protein n=1 Tax=Marichromatium gracile TaxID=1048 RepID=UPI0009ED15F0|nr:FliH/SctL family protein [Marichromatium gracile]